MVNTITHVSRSYERKYIMIEYYTNISLINSFGIVSKQTSTTACRRISPFFRSLCSQTRTLCPTFQTVFCIVSIYCIISHNCSTFITNGNFLLPNPFCRIFHNEGLEGFGSVGNLTQINQCEKQDPKCLACVNSQLISHNK